MTLQEVPAPEGAEVVELESALNSQILLLRNLISPGKSKVTNHSVGGEDPNKTRIPRSPSPSIRP